MEQEFSHILVIDDDDDIRELLRDRLEFMGHTVSTATNGLEGLDSIASERPDLVMLDIQMPKLDGFGVLKGIAEKALDTTVVMITANGTVERAVQAMQEGAFDFLLKPFEPRDVERRVNRALAQVRLEKENIRLQEELAQAQQRLIREMQGELQAAHDMQMQLLPDNAPEMEHMELAGTCIPARQVGGDYYTFLDHIGENRDRLGIVVADVSGKGMQAATVAMRFNEMLRYESDAQGSAAEILKGLDVSLRGRIPPEMFVTCGIAELDLQTCHMRFATGACPEVYHFVNEQQEALPLGLAGFPLGMPFVLDVSPYENVDVVLKPGDVVVFTSDGVEEARNENDEFYGSERLQKLIERSCRSQLCAEEIRDRVVEDVVMFSGEAPKTDDLTVVVLRVKP